MIKNAPPIPEPATIRVLIADSDLKQRVLSTLSACQVECSVAETASDLLESLNRNTPVVVLADLAGVGHSATEIAQRCQRQGCLIRIDSSANAWPSDISSYADLTPSSVDSSLPSTLQGARQFAVLNRDLQRARRRLSQILSHEVVGFSPVMTGMRQLITDLSTSQEPVFLWGESGTGKKLLARMIHTVSDRAHAPLVTVNCRILPSTQLDRDLFVSDEVSPDVDSAEHAGRLAGARGGVLILEDVDQLSLPLQVRLLRALEGGGVNRRPLDVRVIAISSQSPEEAVRSGHLREDFARYLTAKTLQTSPLREHMEDLCPLVEHILAQWALREGRPVCRLMTDALQVLQAYNWPGNVQELQSVIERACSVSTTFRLTADDVLPWMSRLSPGQLMTKTLTLAEMERRLIEATFGKFGGNREKTAQALDIGLRTLSGKLREYGYPPRGGPGSNLKVHDRRAA